MAKVAFLSGASGQTTIDGLSRAVTAFFVNDGVRGDNDLLITQSASPDNKVLMAIGSAVIGFNAPVAGGDLEYYFVFADATEQATIQANSSGNPRIDAVVMKVNTAGVGSNDNSGAGVLQVVQGTAAATPAAPTDAEIQTAVGAGVRWIKLANVAVANGFTTITNANITDLRPKTNTTRRIVDDLTTDFIATGLVWSQTSGLVGAQTTGYGYIAGRLVYKPAISKTFTASKDTYIDLPSTALPTSTDDLTYTAVANGAAAPSLAAGSIRLAKVVTNGSAITSVIDMRNTSPLVSVDKIRVLRSVNQTLSTGTEAPVSFDTCTYQRTAADMWTIGDATKVYIKTPGKYRMSANAFLDTNNSGYRAIYFKINGSGAGLAATQIAPVTGGPGTGIDVSDTYTFNAGDYVQVYIYQNSGGNLDILSCRFSLEMIP